jgi:hypothetical protein
MAATYESHLFGLQLPQLFDESSDLPMLNQKFPWHHTTSANTFRFFISFGSFQFDAPK